MNEPNFISVILTLVVFVLAIWIRRPIEALLSGSLVGLVILEGREFITGFADASLRVMTNDDVAWVILVCGFMGSLIGAMHQGPKFRQWQRHDSSFGWAVEHRK